MENIRGYLKKSFNTIIATCIGAFIGTMLGCFFFFFFNKIDVQKLQIEVQIKDCKELEEMLLMEVMDDTENLEIEDVEVNE
jgi:hypothetical protein